MKKNENVAKTIKTAQKLIYSKQVVKNTFFTMRNKLVSKIRIIN